MLSSLNEFHIWRFAENMLRLRGCCGVVSWRHWIANFPLCWLWHLNTKTSVILNLSTLGSAFADFSSDACKEGEICPEMQIIAKLANIPKYLLLTKITTIAKITHAWSKERRAPAIEKLSLSSFFPWRIWKGSCLDLKAWRELNVIFLFSFFSPWFLLLFLLVLLLLKLSNVTRF